MTRIEERLADALRAIDEMSGEIARQTKTIDRLEQRVAMLMGREAARETEASGGVVLGDERPPHY
ncbi:MAG: SlyX family protein [Pseudomonadota bacterium]